MHKVEGSSAGRSKTITFFTLERFALLVTSTFHSGATSALMMQHFILKTFKTMNVQMNNMFDVQLIV